AQLSVDRSATSWNDRASFRRTSFPKSRTHVRGAERRAARRSGTLGGPDRLLSVGTPMRRPVAIGSIVAVHTGLGRVGDVVGTVLLEDLLCPLHLVAVFRVH